MTAYGVLCDWQLRNLVLYTEAVMLDDMKVPDAQIQPASIDLTLGSEFRRPVHHNHTHIDLAKPVPEDLTELVTVGREGYVLQPNERVLGVTRETIRVPDNLVGRMEGKSSLGRLFLLVHITAGFFDPGFHGRGTLEFVNLNSVPIVLRPRLPICQFSFMTMTGTPEKPYNGRYQGDRSVAPSRYGHVLPRHESEA